ncbi:MAG: hypothetical protein QMD32_09400, partial [Smithellaceae bacterium]|nr:hypothetical protein [Smithellaceae bacterium]
RCSACENNPIVCSAIRNNCTLDQDLIWPPILHRHTWLYCQSHTRRDLNITEGILDVLDHSAPQACFGGKLGIDLTAVGAGEAERRIPPLHDPPDEEAFRSDLAGLSERFISCRIIFPAAAHPLFLLSVRKGGEKIFPALGRLFLSLDPPLGAIAVFFDERDELDDGSVLLWRVLNNTDPRRDMTLENERLLIDATQKGPEDGFLREWPEDVIMDGEVAKKALEKAKRWGVI